MLKFNPILNALKRIYTTLSVLIEGGMCYWYDYLYFYRNSRMGKRAKDEGSRLYSIIARYHVIEKGLSMPNRRLGFGQPALCQLINECDSFIIDFGQKQMQLLQALSVIKEYSDVHKEAGYILRPKTSTLIEKILSKTCVCSSKQPQTTKLALFQHVEENFSIFSASRRSVRNFLGPANVDLIKKAISLAQNAPSACNKQPVKLHVVLNKEANQFIMDLQQGNRGFGHLIKQSIVVTVDVRSYVRFTDRHNGYLDAGLLSMNLLYALHYYKIGAIPLVWISNKNRDNTLRSKLEIPEWESICLIIGIGEPVGDFSLTESKRNCLTDILSIHE